MDKSVLYLGDTALCQAASYLAGVMSFYEIGFDYLPSDAGFDDSLLENNYKAFIISDYPAKNFSSEQLASIAKKVEQGTGFWMIGGWESFTGPNHEYNQTILKEVLPVIMQPEDDRVNCFGPCLIKKAADHAVIGSLPFDEQTPGIGGYNLFEAKPDSQTILKLQKFKASRQNGNFIFEPFAKPDPLLVLGSFGKGRVAALATDAAPHWVGGLVDWGDSRVEAQADGAEAIEVGNWYAQFFVNIVNWIMGKL